VPRKRDPGPLFPVGARLARQRAGAAAPLNRRRRAGGYNERFRDAQKAAMDRPRHPRAFRPGRLRAGRAC
jgi:hypothetical protein